MTQPITADSHGIGEQDVFGSRDVQVTRCRFAAPGPLSAVSVVYTNIRHLDLDNGNDITIQSSVECTDTSTGIVPVKFSGSLTKVLTPGEVVESDPVTLRVPAGSYVWVRTKITIAGGENYAFNYYTVSGNGEGVVNLPGGTDYMTTAGETVTPASDWAYTAALVRGTPAGTARKAVALCGDSIQYGIGNSLIYRGFTELALGSDVPYAKAATPGDTTANFLSSDSAGRRSLIEGCTYAILNLGINDIRGGVSLATIKANYELIRTYLATVGIDTVYLTTITPNTTSTDSWATTGNQTTALTGGKEAIRTALNDWIRTTPAGFAGYFETADTVETSRNSGIWKVGYTDEGLHPNATGHAAMAAAVDASLFIDPLLGLGDELSLVGMEIGAVSLNVERLKCDFGSGYGASASVGVGSGLWGWEIASDVLPDSSDYGNLIEGMPRFQYYEKFYRDHTEGAASDVFRLDFRGRQFHACFADDEIGGEMHTYDVLSLSGMKLKMRRLPGVPYSADGAIDTDTYLATL